VLRHLFKVHRRSYKENWI